MLWLLCLAPMTALQDQKDEKKFDLSRAKVFVYDSARGMTLKVGEDGKVELTVPEEKDGKREMRTYSAPSVEEFRKNHPELVEKYRLERHFSPGAVPEGEFRKWWEDLKKRRPTFDFPELPEFKIPFEDEDWGKWMEEQRKRFEELRKRFAPFRGGEPAPEAPRGEAPAPGREFGIRADSVSDTLRDQLSLKEGEGVVVGELKEGSLAEKSGLKRHDIILKVDGREVTGKWQFRRDLHEALAKPEFELEVLRGGKRETLKVKSGEKKEE
jgi:hypothetical protein